MDIVVNLNPPKLVEEYIHQIGHTGPLGNAGKTILIFDRNSDDDLAAKLITVLKKVSFDWYYNG